MMMIRTLLGVYLAVFGFLAVAVAGDAVRMAVGPLPVADDANANRMAVSVSTGNSFVFIPNANIATEGFLRVTVVPTTVCAPNAIDVLFGVDRLVVDRFSPFLGGALWNEQFQENRRIGEIVSSGSAEAIELNFAQRGMSPGFYRIRIDPQLRVVEGRTFRCLGVNVPDPTTVNHVQVLYFFVEAGLDEWAATEFRELARVRSAALIDLTAQLERRGVNQVVELRAMDRPATGDETYFVLYQLANRQPVDVYVALESGGRLDIIGARYNRTRPVFVLTVNARTGASYGAQLIDNPLSSPSPLAAFPLLH